MPTKPFQRHASSETGERVGQMSASIMTDASSTPVATQPAPTVASAAHRAVNSILEATERVAAGGANVVNMRFSVAGSDLAVRVELRSGEVHVTFRSDSTELRNALAQEWQAVSSSEAGRPLRSIDPVFSSSKSPGFGAASGDGGSQSQRDPSARQYGEPAHPTLPAASPPSFFSGLEPASIPTRVVPLETALRLHAFA